MLLNSVEESIAAGNKKAKNPLDVKFNLTLFVYFFVFYNLSLYSLFNFNY